MNFEKLTWTAVAATFAVCIGAAPLPAAAGPKPRPPQAQAPTPKPAQAPKAQAPKSPKPPASNAKAKPTAPKTSTTKSASKNTGAKSKSTTTTTTTSGSSTSPTTDTATEPLSKAQQKLASNPKLAQKMEARLPAGTDVNLAASGFKNLGQFVAAVNVSNNLGIPFADLKLAMTGVNAEGVRVEGATTSSLGQAIQQLKGVDPTTATETANTAMSQANTEITSTTTTSKSKGKSKKNGAVGSGS